MKNKKKNKNKGFTLVELLAVVVILLAISIMAISSISAAIERNKAKQNEAKKEVIVSYAQIYYAQHKNTLESKKKYFILLTDLDLDESEMKDADNNDIKGCVIFKTGGKNFEFTSDMNKCK